MKKLILSLTVVALTSVVSVSATNINNNNSDEVIVVVMNDGFKEVEIKELPEAVATAFLKDFSSSAIVKAYVNDSEQYKIELTDGGESNSVVYIDKVGKWLKKEEVSTVEVE